MATSPSPSPFFHPPPVPTADSLAILHLKRDSLLPLTLRSTADDGYAEGAVTNTRFGSFPHTTLIGTTWGSQVRASKVDTGTRGRKGKGQQVQVQQQQVQQIQQVQQKVAAAEVPISVSGQVVSPADENSTVAASAGEVSRKRKQDGDLTSTTTTTTTTAAAAEEEPALKVRKTQLDTAAPTPAAASAAAVPMAKTTAAAQTSKPAAVVPISAGSGFVHILPPTPETWTASLDHRTQVVYVPDYSYILQRLRVRPGDRMIEAGAGSGSFTHAAARAVFNGYGSPSASDISASTSATTASTSTSQSRGQVYSYEFHAPRVATLQSELHSHGLSTTVTLTHRDVCSSGFSLPSPQKQNITAIFLDLPAPWLALKHLTRDHPSSVLHPTQTVHLCTFSPCIEQVMATVSEMRKMGWTEISMMEVMNKRLDVRRERIGFKEEGLRGVNATAKNVDEALERLREVELKISAFHSAKPERAQDPDGVAQGKEKADTPRVSSKQQRLDKNKREAEERKLYKEGLLTHRTEPEVKTHTSYLVFALLPRAWSAEDEERAKKRWGGERK